MAGKLTREKEIETVTPGRLWGTSQKKGKPDGEGKLALICRGRDTGVLLCSLALS